MTGMLLEGRTESVRRRLDFRVDEARCTGCGLCAAECPLGLISGEVPRVDEPGRCVRCQHCMAVCPEGALSIEGRDPAAGGMSAAPSLPTLAQMTGLVRSRRSIRRYQDRDVDPALIGELLRSTAYAPTGVNALALTFTVVERRARLRAFREEVLAALARCAREHRLPPYLAFLGEAAARPEADPIFRGAPHLLIASAPLTAPGAQNDVPIALATFELLAVSAGLGTVWCGMLKLALEAEPALKRLLDLPAEGIHYYPLLFGHPAVDYPRSVQRDDAALIKRLQ